MCSSQDTSFSAKLMAEWTEYQILILFSRFNARRAPVGYFSCVCGPIWPKEVQHGDWESNMAADTPTWRQEVEHGSAPVIGRLIGVTLACSSWVSISETHQKLVEAAYVGKRLERTKARSNRSDTDYVGDSWKYRRAGVGKFLNEIV